MKISIRHRKTCSLAVFCALTSVFLILYGCGNDDNGGGGTVAVTHTISGQVTSTGSGLSGVTMTLSGASSATTTTDASGNYTFTNLDNGSYTVTPSKTGFTFGPTDNTQTVSGANIIAVNFTATPVQAGPHSISGNVISVALFSTVPGVTMALSGASTATAITDASGNYAFTGLDNGSYTITPSKTGFTFSPTSSTQTVNGTDITGVNFIATSVQVGIFSISGQATWNGSGLIGVRMDLNGGTLASVTTDNVGNYTFTGLNNGSYTVTPNKPDVTFSPTSSQRTVSGANITAVNFTATPTKAGPYIIFGYVSAASSGGTTGLIGVTMTLNGASSATTTTDIYGTYQFTGLSNGSHTITPIKTGFTFSPTSNTQTVNGQDITGVAFSASSTQNGQIVTCPPSGTTNVTIQDFSFTLQNVTISANGIVMWTNNGSTHTVTSGTSPTPDGKFNSGNLGTGATVCVQFPATGTYPYFCNIHPSMIGSVVVQ